MALVDLPTIITTERSRAQHITDHSRLHMQAQGGIHSSDYATLQDAVDDAKVKQRPLTIAPGTYMLATPLQLHNCAGLHVLAYNALLVAGVNMAAVVDVKNCKRCTWHGGWINVPTGRVVDNALYVYYDTAQCTRNMFYDLTIEGDYSVGIRIGKQGSGSQCDHMYFDNVELVGRSLPGQVGIHVGTGRFANCLNHTFVNLMTSLHETHIVVDATNAYFTNVFMSGADVDFYISSTNVAVRNVRSENAKRFLVTSGPSGYGATLSFEDVLWAGSFMAADGEWIRTYLSGLLQLRNINIEAAAVAPKIKANPGAKLLLSIDGMISISEVADLCTATIKVTVHTANCVTMDADGLVVSVTP